MGSFPSQSRPASAAPVRVPPLTSSTVDGQPYERRADIEGKILGALARGPTEWVTMAVSKGEDRLPDEALVFLIRTQNADRDLLGQLICELSRRTARVAGDFAQGFGRETLSELVLEVQNQVVDLVLEEGPSRQGEFLEVAFQTAVKHRTLNAVAKYKHSLRSKRQWATESYEDDAESQTLIESVPASYPSPEELIAQVEDEVQRRELVSRARGAVRDPRHLEAVILRYGYGWPMTDRDPTKATLTRYFGKSARQIQNWIHEALEAMRAAIGDKR